MWWISVHYTGFNDNNATESDHADIMLQVTNIADSREDAHKYQDSDIHEDSYHFFMPELVWSMFLGGLVSKSLT